MLKKFLALLSIISMLVLNCNPIEANAIANSPLVENFEIINDTSIQDMDKEEVYIFNNKQDRDAFISLLTQEQKGISPYACIPGDPGYPNCSGNVVVKVDSVRISISAPSGWKKSGNLLDSWTNGGSYGGSMSITDSKTLSFNVNGIGISVTTGTSQTFNVPKGKESNIIFEARFRTETRQFWYTLQNGSRVKGANYQLLHKYDARFSPVYRNN